MAFLNTLKSAPMPPIKNVLKDAWQTAKQSMPDRQRQQQYEDPTSEYGGSSQVSHGSSQQRPHNVHFADSVGENGQQIPTELNPLNPFKNPSVSATNPFGEAASSGGYQYEETGFNQSDQNYQDGGFPPR
jgi:solute carrier family 32 (vesicular inhibitory amino acid transporter)